VNELQPEAGARPRALVDPPEVLAVDANVLSAPRLLGRRRVLEHADRDHGVEGLLRSIVQIRAELDAHARQAPTAHVIALRARERDAVRVRRPSLHRQVLEHRAPPASHVDHAHPGANARCVRNEAELRELRLLLARGVLVQTARVVHSLVEPDPEELVADVVRHLDVMRGGHVASPFPTGASSPRSRTAPAR